MKIAVVGGGLSGTLVCLNLLRKARQPLEIFLVEKHSDQLNKGIAYSAIEPDHLLNVAASGMSLFEKDPAHFTDWLQQHHPELGFTADDFVPRQIFGKYLKETFNEEVVKHKQHSLHIIKDEATDIVKEKGHYSITFREHGSFRADKVFLCIGNFPPSDAPGINEEAKQDPHYIATPWSEFTIEKVGKDDEVFLLGAGLTMVDQIISLYQNGHRGKITILSRRGLLPLVHDDAPHYDAKMQPPANATVDNYFEWIKREIAIARSEGKNWRSVFNAIRHITPELWSRLNAEEKNRFLRHLRPYWEIHRHRIPAKSMNIIDELIGKGQARLLAGRINLISREGDKFRIDYTSKGAAERSSFTANWVVNCTGTQGDYRRVRSELVSHLLQNGLLSMDELFMGFEVTLEGWTINRDGEVDRDLCIVGPPARGMLWECTALREIRKQAGSVLTDPTI